MKGFRPCFTESVSIKKSTAIKTFNDLQIRGRKRVAMIFHVDFFALLRPFLGLQTGRPCLKVDGAVSLAAKWVAKIGQARRNRGSLGLWNAISSQATATVLEFGIVRGTKSSAIFFASWSRQVLGRKQQSFLLCDRVYFHLVLPSFN